MMNPEDEYNGSLKNGPFMEFDNYHAVLFGVKAAIVIGDLKQKLADPRCPHRLIHNGEAWLCIGTHEWSRTSFRAWSRRTLVRILGRLKRAQVICAQRIESNGGSMSYRLDTEWLDEICRIHAGSQAQAVSE